MENRRGLARRRQGGRRIRTTSLLLALLGSVALLWPRTGPAEAPPTIRPAMGWAVALPVEGGYSRFRLASQSSGQLVLVVGSLGEPGVRHQVTLRRSPSSPDSLASRRADTTAHTSKSRLIRPYRPPRHSPPLVFPVAYSLIGFDTPVDEVRHFDIPLISQTTPGQHDHARVRARTIACGQRVRVFLDDAESLTPRLRHLAIAVIRLLETSIMPATDRTFGPPADVDGDEHLSVLLTSWLGRLQKGTTAVGGFVRIDDFRTDLPRPGSNRADLMYLNTSLNPGNHLADVVSHEYTHVLACSARAPSPRHPAGLPLEDDWLNEAIAHLSEPGTSNISHRVARFLEAPGEYPLVVPDYYKAGLWRCDGCRGATYLFLRWCQQRHDPMLTVRLVRSPWWGIRNVEAVTGENFSVLFRDWCLALLSLPLASDTRGLQRPPLEDWATDRPLTLTVAGTAATYLRLLHPGDIVVEVKGAPGSRLQLTLANVPRVASGPTDALPSTFVAGRKASAGVRSSTIAQPYCRR